MASRGCSSHTCLALCCGLPGNTLPLNARKRWDLSFISTKSEVAFLISAKFRKESDYNTSLLGCKTVERANCVQCKAVLLPLVYPLAVLSHPRTGYSPLSRLTEK